MQAADDISLEYARLRVRIGLVPASEQPLLDGRYRIEQTLGRGAMGVVYRVWDERLRRRVALKLVRPMPGVSTERLQARLEREALALAKVDHPNVVHLHDVGTHDGAAYFTMQLVPGTTLRRWQCEAGRTPSEVIDAYLQAGRGLAAAHATNLVHRDFKPDNVLVGEDGIVRVADFGIAAALAPEELQDTIDAEGEASQRMISAVGSTGELTPDSNTATGMMMGTPPYMAPEQLVGQRATARSDQFGFCVALVEALTGSRPFFGHTRGQLIDAIRRGLPRTPRISGWLRAIVQRGLASGPSDRFATMSELIRAIEHARARRRRFAIGGGLGLALVGAAALGWALEPDEPQIEREDCESFVAALDEVWSTERRGKLERLREIDERTIDHVIARTEQLAEAWRISARSLCEQDLSGAAWAPVLDSQQRVCHVAWLTALARNLDLLIANGSASTLEHAPELFERLVPAQGDYCAFVPDPIVDPKFAELATQIREAAEFGDFPLASRLAQDAITRARSLAPSGYSAELAELLEAQGELFVLSGEFDAAAVCFSQAHASAMASGHRRALLDIALWRAHAAVAPGRPSQPDLAALHLEDAEPLAHALALGPDDPRRGDLEIIRALVEQQRHELDRARTHLERAHAIHLRAGQPIRAARASINLATLDLERGELPLAQRGFDEAARLLDGAGVPERHRLRLTIDYHVGLIAYASSDLAGLDPLDRVARLHGDPITRLRALGYAIAIAFDVGTLEQAHTWAERAMTELASTKASRVPEDLALEIEASAAYVEASLDVPGAEAKLDLLEQRAATLDEETHVNLRCSRIDWLEERTRCPEAAAKLAALDAHVATLDDEFRARVYAPWRATKPAAECLNQIVLGPPSPTYLETRHAVVLSSLHPRSHGLVVAPCVR